MLVADKATTVIIEYSSHKKTFIYKPFSHRAHSNSLDDLNSLIIDNTVFYAFSENEILSKDSAWFDDLHVAAKYAFAQRLPKRFNANTDGTLGEILLDLLIQVYEPTTQKLIARAKYTEPNKATEITGYDALYFTKCSKGITLWLGQAKTGAQNYCKSGTKYDLNSKYSSEYFANTAFYIVERSEAPELSSIIDEINDLCFEAQKLNFSKDRKATELFNILNKSNVQVKIPCLLAYTNDIYTDPILLKEEIDACANTICSYFDPETYSIDLQLPYEVVFYVFPIKDVSYIRNQIAVFKKGVVY